MNILPVSNLMSVPALVADSPIAEKENIIAFLKQVAPSKLQDYLALLNVTVLTKENSTEIIQKIFKETLPYKVSQYLSLLKIKDELALFKLTEELTTQPDATVAVFIHTYGITNQEHLFQIAKSSVVFCNEDICKYIRNFGITNQKYLFELAELLLEGKCVRIHKFIQDFGIEDPNLRYQLAMKSASFDASYVECTAKYIQNYGITNPDHLYEIAKVAAKGHISSHIAKFGITDSSRLFEIAKITAEAGRELPAYIQSYGLNSNDQLYELAKITAKRNPNNTCACIENFGLNQDQLFEIAKTIAAHEGQTISMFIDNFKIKDQEKLLEIAKIAAHQNPKDTLQYLNCYKLDNPWEVIVLVFKLDPWNCVTRIKYFSCNADVELIRKIALLAVLAMGRCTTFTFSGSTDSMIERVDGRFKEFEDNITPLTVKLDPQLSELINLNELTQKIKTWSNINFACRTYIALKSFVFRCGQYSDQTNFISFLKHHPKLLSAIFEEREISIYWGLLSSIFLCHPNVLEKIIANEVERQLILLPLLPLDFEEKENLIQKILQCNLKDARLRIPLIQLMLELANNISHSTFNKALCWVLENPKMTKQVLKRVLIINAIANMKGDLNKIDTIPAEIILTDRLKEILPELQFTLADFQKTFFKMRNPLAILIYLGKLATLPEKEPLNLLTLVMNSIFANKFKETRQNIDKNKHLKFLNEKYPHILNQFYENRIKEINLNQDSEKQEKHTALKTIIKNALGDYHLKDTDLIKFNQDHIPVEEQNFARLRKFPHDLPQLESDIRQISKEKGECHKKDLNKFAQLNSYLTYLKMQLLAMRLMDKDITEAHFNEFCTFFDNVLKEDCEFRNDIQSMLALFKDKKLNEKYTLYDTDDPYEILLCGSEVEGSCQRIEGNPKLNRGLLGYFLNGQTRLLIVKENETILGRAVIRLLLNELNEPVLFIERIYPQTLNPKLKRTLLDFAVEKAMMLKISLLCCTHTPNYYGSVKNIGVQAPEYIDSAGGIINEEYCINSSGVDPILYCIYKKRCEDDLLN